MGDRTGLGQRDCVGSLLFFVRKLELVSLHHVRGASSSRILRDRKWHSMTLQEDTISALWTFVPLFARRL